MRWLLLLSLAAAGCCAGPSPGPSPAPSAAALIRPEPPASSSAEPEPLDPAAELRRRGAPLAGPFSTTCSPEVVNGCRRDTFAIYGNDHGVDGAWVIEEGKDGSTRMKPLRGWPAATRLLKAEARPDAAYVLLSTLAAGPQPEGLRGVVVLDEEAVLNWPNELVSPAPPGDDLAATVDAARVSSYGFELVSLLSERKGSQLALIERWLDPQGLLVDEVWQGLFRRTTETVPRGGLASWKGSGELQRMLQRASLNDCIMSPAGSCRLHDGKRWSELRLGGNDEHPTLRAVLRDASTPEPPRSAPRRVEPGGWSKRLIALLARAPIETRRLADALLGGGGELAVLSPQHPLVKGPLLALVEDDRSHAIHELSEAAEAGFDALSSRPEVAFLDADGDGTTDVLLRFERPSKEPWSGLFLVKPPLRSRAMHHPGGPTLEPAFSFWAAQAPSLDAAVAAILAAPRRPVPEADAARVIKASRSAQGFRSNSAPGAVVFGFRGLDPVADRSQLKRREELTDEDVRWMPDPGEIMECWRLWCSSSMPTCHCQLHGGSGYHQFWFVWDGGQPRLMGAGRHLD